MENKYPLVRFVICPKCLKLLTEFSEIPVYKCGGCGAILQAKVHSNSGQILSSVSAIPHSDVTGVVEQAEINTLNVSESSSDNICKENSLGHEQNEIKNLDVSEFNVEIHKTKRDSESSSDYICKEKSLGHEQNEIKNLDVSEFNVEIHKIKSESESSSDNICKENSLRHEQNEIQNLDVSEFNVEIQKTKSGSESSGDNICKEKSLGHEQRLEEVNQELEKSPDVNSETYDSRKPSDKFIESSESMDDMMNMEFGNGSHFRMTSRSSSQAYAASVSSVDEDRKNPNFRLSRRTFRNKIMSNTSNSTITTTAEEDLERRFSKCSYPPKDVKVVKINQRFSEQDNQVNILSRFDELRNDLTGLFDETTDSKESSQFLQKTPSKPHRSSLIPFSMHPSSSYFHDYNDKCCHNICCHLSEPATLPRHIESETINPEQKNPQFKVSRTQSVMRLCRPVSGGAPFVVCYNCFKLLQLPADFLVTSKRVNKLRCGACSQVLMYFFKPRTRSMPQTPVEDRHPPSEEINDERNVAAILDFSAWDPISSSESNSSVVESVLHKSRSFNEIVEEEQTEGGLLKGSRLHKLMGYSSASELLLHDGYSYDECQSAETPKNYRPSGRKRWERH